MVTILIPCYNGEKYLKRCIDSCISQTYKDLKILIVNDGSTDNSKNIIEQYVKNNKNIKLINQKNKGLASTRNVLLSNLDTHLGYFLDVDDWIDNDTIENMVSALNQNDMVVNSYYIDNGKKKKVFYIGNKINNKTSNESYLVNNTPFAWGILFKKEVFKNYSLFCEDSQFFEDAGLISYLIFKTKKISFINNPGYHYFVNKNSLSRTTRMNYEKISSAIIQLDHFYKLIRKENFSKLPKPLNDQLAFYHCIIFTYIQFQSKINKKERKDLKLKLKKLEKRNYRLKIPKRYWKKWYFILYRAFLY